MKSLSKILFICLFAVFGFSLTSQAMEGVTLDDALLNVAKSNPQIKEALESYESTVAERKIARKGYRPTIGVEAYTGPMVTDGVPTNNVSEELWENSATAYIRQNLFEGFGTEAYIDETEARIMSSAYGVLNTANDVFLNVAEAYVNVLSAREQVAIAEKNVLTQARILKQIKERSDSGFGRASDLTNSESRLALSRGNFISRQQDLNQALTQFHRLYGRILTPEQFVMPETKFDLPESVQDAVDMAFGNHPALRVARYNIIVRKHTRERAEADFWPTLDLLVSAGWREDTGGERGETDEYGAALEFNYLLYDGGARYGEKDKAYRQILQEYQKAYDERRNVNELVRLAWNILVAEKNKKDFLSEHVRLSKQTLDEFVEEFHAGKRDLLEILDMEIEYYTAQASMIESNYSYLIAYYRSIQAIGSLLVEFENDLSEKVGLTEPEAFDIYSCDELEKELDVEGIVVDADGDTMDDCADQCDNTAEGATLEAYGCSEIDPSQSGYEVPTELKPYIEN
ncbi:MAG: TolC family outer membrane protein [Desulfobacterales bacterium]|nr:TolC family outer membrane protein [Desulfobacterales bacterium]